MRCAGLYYDFSHVITANGTTVMGEDSDSYSINVCGGIPSVPACTDAALCNKYDGGPNWTALALSHTAPEPVFATSGSDVTLTYNNGQLSGQKVQTVFTFTCVQVTHKQGANMQQHQRGDRLQLLISKLLHRCG
jgi:hypothetical protein